MTGQNQVYMHTVHTHTHTDTCAYSWVCSFAPTVALVTVGAPHPLLILKSVPFPFASLLHVGLTSKNIFPPHVPFWFLHDVSHACDYMAVKTFNFYTKLQK